MAEEDTVLSSASTGYKVAAVSDLVMWFGIAMLAIVFFMRVIEHNDWNFHKIEVYLTLVIIGASRFLYLIHAPMDKKAFKKWLYGNNV